jgi:alpha-glucosidase/alpha-D-xyloside xylohydrolase
MKNSKMFPKKLVIPFLTVSIFVIFSFRGGAQVAQTIYIDNSEQVLEIGSISDNTLRIVLKPVGAKYIKPPFIESNLYEQPTFRISKIGSVVRKSLGNLTVTIEPNPLRVNITNINGQFIQEITFMDNGEMTFALDNLPILGMGEGGPKPDKETDWRKLEVEYDRKGRLHNMKPRWQSDAYGSRNPVPLLIGTCGWGLFVASPWVEVDLTSPERGVLIPLAIPDSLSPQNQKNQGLNIGKGIPPIASTVPGLKEIFIFDAHEPTVLMKDLALLTGNAVMPPKWALGYMQSHRTLENERQMIEIVETFREKKIPLDAVIYLGTGFAPRGWNKTQPSFEFNPEVFKRDSKVVIDDLHAQHVKTVLHIVPWDRDKLPSLHGTIPIESDEQIDQSHIFNYWQQHNELMAIGIDAFWPDEGDWFDLYERLKRHQMYYQGPIFTRPNVRPWSLHRNGFLGIAKWGGWIWSGDTDSSWKTLEAQIAVGINSSLSISPFWGSDIGGFYPNPEKTGELYARWFQFATFCPSFRSHTRTWHTGLPWGWGLNDMGPRENNGNNDFISKEIDSLRNPLQSEMNNPTIEPIVKQYAELRYQLLPYNYSLAWEARNSGMPMMRSLWLQYPEDSNAIGNGKEYLWGKDLLIAPVFEKNATVREVYLPKGQWYDWWTHTKVEGGRTVFKKVDLSVMPIYVRAGAIVPLDPVRQYTEQKVEEPTLLQVWKGANGNFILYEDDGSSLEYLKGDYSQTKLTWNDDENKLTVEPIGEFQDFSGVNKRIFKIEIMPENTLKVIEYTGERIEINF